GADQQVHRTAHVGRWGGGLTVPITVAPRWRAQGQRKWPMPPAAAWMRTKSPGCNSTEDFVAVTRKITDGRGVDVVYESIGKDTLQRSLDCLKLVGMCAAYGQASGVPDPI